MQTMMILFLFSMFFAIFGLISYYVFLRGLQAIPKIQSLRSGYILAFWFLTLSFPGGRLLENSFPPILTNPLIWIGSVWLGALLYFFIAVVLLDGVRLIHHFRPVLPAAVQRKYDRAKLICAAGIFGLTGLILAAGYINAAMPRIKKMDLGIAKKAGPLHSLKIVAVSDIHLGTIMGRDRIDPIVQAINSLNPDIVLLPGDIVDEDIAPVISQNLGGALKNLRSRYGTYAVTGNHEFIGGAEEACAYLQDHGVTMLRDASLKIADSLYLVGREDRSVGRRGNKRKGLNELMAAVDTTFPVILMDHQPFGLQEASVQGIDLQLSGHTHYGQLWPLNYIVESIYEIAWGYARIGKTHYYVSSGVGTWGPPMRIGNYPEIMQIQLHFQR